MKPLEGQTAHGHMFETDVARWAIRRGAFNDEIAKRDIVQIVLGRRCCLVRRTHERRA